MDSSRRAIGRAIGSIARAAGELATPAISADSDKVPRAEFSGGFEWVSES